MLFKLLDACSIGHVLSFVEYHHTLGICMQSCREFRDEATSLLYRRYATQSATVDAVLYKLLVTMGESWKFQRIRSFEWIRHVHTHSPQLRCYLSKMVAVGTTHRFASHCGMYGHIDERHVCAFCRQNAELQRRERTMQLILDRPDQVHLIHKACVT
jgi:hypothetical protein